VLARAVDRAADGNGKETDRTDQDVDDDEDLEEGLLR
jgi:hypothetical protein